MSKSMKTGGEVSVDGSSSASQPLPTALVAPTADPSDPATLVLKNTDEALAARRLSLFVASQSPLNLLKPVLVML